jgi:FkbM family methyltransferase
MIKNWLPTTTRTVQLLNGFLLARIGAKLVRKLPENFSYRKNPSIGTQSKVSLTSVADRRTSEISLREATSDWLTFDQIFVNEDYNLRQLKRYPEIEGLYNKFSAEGTPLILDLGANIGLSSVYFSHIWPASKIVAVEPSDDNFAILKQNTQADQRIEAILAGVASTETKLALNDPTVEKNAFTTKTLGADAVDGIDGVTVNGILNRYPASKGFRPFIIKIDIEGAEEELFSQNIDWISEFPVLMIEMHDWLYPGKGTSRAFLQAISKLDRDFVYLNENVFSIRNDRSAP